LGGLKPWWSPEDAQLTCDLIRDYNVIGLLHGHSHGKKIYKWNGIDVFDDGTTQNGDALVFHIVENRMFVVNIIGEKWGGLKLEKTISLGRPVPTTLPAPGAIRGADQDMFFSISGDGLIYHGAGAFEHAAIRDITGRLVWETPVSSPHLFWNRLRSNGSPAGAGIYALELRGRSGSRNIKIVLK
jgi:hypothetical protein